MRQSGEYKHANMANMGMDNDLPDSADLRSALEDFGRIISEEQNQSNEKVWARQDLLQTLACINDAELAELANLVGGTPKEIAERAGRYNKLRDLAKKMTGAPDLPVPYEKLN